MLKFYIADFTFLKLHFFLSNYVFPFQEQINALQAIYERKFIYFDKNEVSVLRVFEILLNAMNQTFINLLGAT